MKTVFVVQLAPERTLTWLAFEPTTQLVALTQAIESATNTFTAGSMGTGELACDIVGVGVGAKENVITPPPKSVARHTSEGVHETALKALVSLGEKTTESGDHTPS
jgi:hypothetical protein